MSQEILKKYRDLCAQLSEAQRADNDKEEDRLLPILDHIWYDEMTEEDRTNFEIEDLPMAQDQKVYTVLVEKDPATDLLVISLPAEAVEKLGWKEGDRLSLDETQISWEGFEGKGLVVSKQE